MGIFDMFRDIADEVIQPVKEVPSTVSEPLVDSADGLLDVLLGLLGGD